MRSCKSVRLCGVKPVAASGVRSGTIHRASAGAASGFSKLWETVTAVEFLAVDLEGCAQADARRLGFLDRRVLGRFDEAVHLAERRDAGDRLLAEGPGVGDGAEQFAVDVDGAAAHAGDDAGLVEVQAGQPAKDHVAAGAGVLEHAEDLGLEGLDLGPLHDGAAVALHAGADVVDLPEIVLFRRRHGESNLPTGERQHAQECGKSGDGQVTKRLFSWPRLQRGAGSL